MRHLYLIRHAKSSWKDASLPDHDRPLNKRGKRDAPLMARRLADRGVQLDCLLVSSARRVALTAEVLAEVLGVTDVRVDEDLYLADPEELLWSIGAVEDEVRSLGVVAHNPGITDLVNLLGGGVTDNVVTLGIAGFSIEGSWGELTAERCQLEFYDFPKNPAS